MTDSTPHTSEVRCNLPFPGGGVPEDVFFFRLLERNGGLITLEHPSCGGAISNARDAKNIARGKDRYEARSQQQWSEVESEAAAAVAPTVAQWSVAEVE